MSPVNVVVVAYRCPELVLACCDSVLDAGEVDLTVVDNASGDGTAEAVKAAFPAVRLLENSANVGFARAVNQGVAAGSADTVLLLNPDARIGGAALERLRVTLGEDEARAAVGPRIRGREGGLELSAGRTMSLAGDVGIRVLEALYAGGRGPVAPLVERAYARPRDVRSLSAACLLLRRRALEAVGGLDERFFLYAEDVDLCLRLRAAGWRLRYEPRAEVTHVRGASGRTEPEAVERAWRASQLALYRKHRSRVGLALLRLWITARYRMTALVGRGERRRRARRMLRWLRQEAP